MIAPRLYHLGGVVLDLVYRIEDLPPSGGERVADAFAASAGGAFHTLAAAAAQGVRVCSAGHHGHGPFGELVRGALDRIGAARLLPTDVSRDTGTCVVLVTRDGERTFVGRPGAEGRLALADLDTIQPATDDHCVLSGYTASFPACRDAVDAWVDRLDAATPLVFDPSPLVERIPTPLLEKILARADWLSANERETRVLAGDGAPHTQLERLLDERCPRACGVVLRSGAHGSRLRLRGGGGTVCPAHEVEVVDTSGAGDVHVGTFVARLALGDPPNDACRVANAAAALSVTRPSGAPAPSPAEVGRLLDMTA